MNADLTAELERIAMKAAAGTRSPSESARAVIAALGIELIGVESLLTARRVFRVRALES